MDILRRGSASVASRDACIGATLQFEELQLQMMDPEAAYKEIEELKFAMDKLKAEYNVKSLLFEQLRRAHDEQLVKFKDAKRDNERQAQKLLAKSEEISLVNQMYEDLNSRFREKESALKCLVSAHDQLRTTSGEKIMALEAQNRELFVSLGDANSKVEEQDKKISEYSREIAGLRCRMVDFQKKCSEAETKVQAGVQLRQREEVLLRLEEENIKVVEQLKWKKEQFKHLEEAYEKLQHQFQTSKRDWEAEKCDLIENISSLEIKLESQTRVTEDLSSRLQICNQDLAHEESRRKLLEIHVLESKASYENAVAECQEVRSKIEKLAERRDEQIAELRNLLSSKDSLLKEKTFCNTRLQQENDELQASLKEFQVSQINEAGAVASLKTLRQKLRNLEQVHKVCLVNLKAKEAAWNLRIENLESDLDECLSKLDFTEKRDQNLQLELEDCYSSMMKLKQNYEEISVMLMIFQSIVSEFSSKYLDSVSHMNELESERTKWKSVAEQANKFISDTETKMQTLKQECDSVRRELETTVLEKLRSEAGFEDEKINFVQAIKLRDMRNEDLRKEIEELQKTFLQKQSEITAHAKQDATAAFDKEKSCLLKIVEKKDKMVESLREKLALLTQDSARSKTEAAMNLEQEKMRLLNLIKQKDVELADLHELFDEERENLSKIVEKKDEIMEGLVVKVTSLEQDCARAKTEATANLEQERAHFLNINKQKEVEIAHLQELKNIEKENLLKIAGEKDEIIVYLSEQVNLLQQDCSRVKEEASAKLEQEIMHLLNINKEKDAKIVDLQKHILSQEQLSKSVETAITLKLAEMQWEINALHQSLQTIMVTHYLDVYEKELKDLVIDEFEEEQDILKLKLEVEERQSFELEKSLRKLEHEVEKEERERNKEIARVGDKLETAQSMGRNLENEIDELKSRSKEMDENYKFFLSERENLVAATVELYNMIASIVNENEIVIEWEKLADGLDNRKECKRENISSDNQFEQRHIEGQKSLERRSPLKEWNGCLSESSRSH